MATLVPLYAAIAPFILWPIEQILPFPFLVEEIAKAIILLPVLNLTDNTKKIKLAAIAGVFFALSESVLYLFNISLVGDLSTFVTRLLLTIPLHVVTSIVIILPALRDKKLIVIGVIFASIIHYFFNSFITKIF